MRPLKRRDPDHLGWHLRALCSSASLTLTAMLPSLALLLSVPPTMAGVLPGAVHNWDAELDETDNALWEDTGSLANRDWTLTGPTGPNPNGPQRLPAASAAQITYTYNFDGIDDSGVNPPENRSGNHDTTFEIWFRPNGFPTGDVRTIFEHGNTNRGVSFGVRNDTLIFTYAFGNPTTPFEFDLDVDDDGIDNPDFIQAVGVVDDTNNQVRFYVDGANEQVQSISSSADFTSNDDMGLAEIKGKGGGGLISSPDTWGGYLAGDIAILREYRSAFGPLEVAQNYAALAVPEPSACVLMLFAAIGFALLRRYR